MDNSLLIGLQTQRVLQRRMDATANNLANAATTGFKADSLVFEMMTKRPARSADDPHDVRFVRDTGIARDMSQGALTNTSNPLDLAIQGEGFFSVGGAGGPLYTRDGAFTLASDGTLSTQDGRPVLSATGSPMVFDPQGETPVVNADGAVTLAGVEVGRVGVFKFPDPANLEKRGDNLYAASGQTATPTDARIVQGALEASNVRPVVELTRLIEISRAYESAARVVKNGDDMRKSTLERLARA